MNHNVHFTFEPITDSWGAHSDENINSGAILSFDADCKVTDSQTTSDVDNRLLSGLLWNAAEVFSSSWPSTCCNGQRKAPRHLK